MIDYIFDVKDPKVSLEASTGFYLFIVFNCDSKLIYRSLGFFSEIVNLHVGGSAGASLWWLTMVAYCGVLTISA